MKPRFLEGLVAPLHISHRGGAALAPENTLLAFRRAVNEFQTDMLELDLHASKDGVLVVAHDPTLERCTNGTGRVDEHSWARLQTLDAGQGARLPRFEEVLDAFPGLRLNVELKAEAAIEPFVRLMKQRDELSRLCIGSEHDSIANELHRQLPDACHFYPRNALAMLVLSLKGGEPPADEGKFTVLDMPLYWEDAKVFDAELARAVRPLGKWINVWTVDDPAEMRAAIADGVGGVMTDRPDLLRQVLGPSLRR